MYNIFLLTLLYNWRFTFLRTTIENWNFFVNYWYKTVFCAWLIMEIWPIVFTAHEWEWRNLVSGPVPNFLTLKEPKNQFQGTSSTRLCSLTGRYDNPVPPRFLAPIDCLKIPAQVDVVKQHKENIKLSKIVILNCRSHRVPGSDLCECEASTCEGWPTFLQCACAGAQPHPLPCQRARAGGQVFITHTEMENT